MRVSLADVGRRGRLELSFALQDGRTVLRDSYCEVPFKITRVLNRDSSVVDLILMQCTAGLFGGDDVHARFESSAARVSGSRSNLQRRCTLPRIVLRFNEPT